MKLYPKIITLFFVFSLLLSSCAPLKPYQKVYVNDSEMQMGLSPDKGFENYVQSIREGAVDATATKGTGGCGCN